MSKIYRECCVCHAKIYHNSKYCNEHRRRAVASSKSAWDAHHRPPKKPFDGVYNHQMTIISDPSPDAAFPSGAKLAGTEVRSLLAVGWMTPGTSLDCQGIRLVVTGHQYTEQRLVSA